MPLHIMRTADERLVGGAVTDLLVEAVSASGSAVLLCPSLSQALDAQRALASVCGLSMGVDCSTPDSWAQLRWSLYGDGRAWVDAPRRAVLMARLMEDADLGPLDDGDGTVEVLCQLVARGLPWLPAEENGLGLSEGETRALALAHRYGELLRERGIVEPCEARALLPSLMAGQGFGLPVFVFAGFSMMDRALREFALSLAGVTEVCVVMRSDGGPASRLVEETCTALLERAERGGIEAQASTGDPDCRRAVAAEHGAPASAPKRAPELDWLLAALFCASGEQGAVRATGAVELLEPAGPLAVDELTCRHVAELAHGGLRDVVVCAPDARATWRGLAPKLHARGIGVRAQLSAPALSTPVASGFLRYAESVAHLAELAESWPSDPAAQAPDMSWWPPRDVTDFMLSQVSGVGVERVWRRDAAWRGNRILTPASVLATLQNHAATSPALAAATRELLRGHLAAAAARLLQAQGPAGGDSGATPGPAGAEPEDAATPMHDVDAPSAEEALARAEGEAALLAIGEAGRALRDAGVSVDDGVPLTRVVGLVRTALSRLRVVCRPELVGGDATCRVRILTPASAATLPPLSAAALVYLGLDSASSPIAGSDGSLDTLLGHLGIEAAPDGLARARADFASAVRVPTARLSLCRPLHDADASETFPAVMLSEVLACYGKVTDGRGHEVPGLASSARTRRDEGLVAQNLEADGADPVARPVEGAAPAGRLDDALRRFVVVPRDGQAELPQGRPSLSASQIETYLECPYKWFTLRRLGLDDVDAGFSNMEMGTFAHRVLEVTHRRLFLEAAQAAGLVGKDCGESPEGNLFWFDPAVRVAGSRVDADTLDHALDLLRAEFDEHLMHQRLEGSRRNSQALVPHGPTQLRRLEELRRDLEGLLDFESARLVGFEPRLFEGRFGGSSGLTATYAGADLVGTIDRIDVDEEGRALVIDYKHKSGVFDEYALSPKGGPDWEGTGEFMPPRRVQTLVYAAVARRLLEGTGVRVVGAVYLGTKGRQQIAGAVAARDVSAVWGPDGLSQRMADRVTVPVPGARDFDELLDRTEEYVAGAIDRMRAGDIDAKPIADDACAWCPVLDCERRRG